MNKFHLITIDDKTYAGKDISNAKFMHMKNNLGFTVKESSEQDYLYREDNVSLYNNGVLIAERTDVYQICDEHHKLISRDVVEYQYQTYLLNEK